MHEPSATESIAKSGIFSANFSGMSLLTSSYQRRLWRRKLLVLLKQLDVFRLLKSKKMARPFPQLWQYALHQFFHRRPAYDWHLRRNTTTKHTTYAYHFLTSSALNWAVALEKTPSSRLNFALWPQASVTPVNYHRTWRAWWLIFPNSGQRNGWKWSLARKGIESNLP